MMRLFKAKNQGYDSDESSDSSASEMSSVESDKDDDNSNVSSSNKSKWDAFFGMDDPACSNSYSDRESSNSSHSSVSSASDASAYARMWSNKAKLSLDDDSDYDSDGENAEPTNAKYRNRMKEPVLNIRHNDGSSESLSAITGSVFSNYVNKVNNTSSSNSTQFTLIPIGGAAQAQYMMIAPPNDASSVGLLTPQSIRSVTLKQGMGSGTTTISSKKIFQTQGKKSHEKKKQFLNINPKNLEQKYDHFKEKRRKIEEERKKEKIRREDNEAEKQKERAQGSSNDMFSQSNWSAPGLYDDHTLNTKDEHLEEMPFVQTMSRLFFPDDKEEGQAKNDSRENAPKGFSSILRSRSQPKDRKSREKANESFNCDSREKSIGSSIEENSKRGRSRSRLRSKSLSRLRGISFATFMRQSRSLSRPRSCSKSGIAEKEHDLGIKITSSSLSKIELVRNKSNGCRENTTQDYVVEDIKSFKNSPMKALKQAFKLNKRRETNKERELNKGASIDTHPSENSVRPTQMAPNKFRSMIIPSPGKKNEEISSMNENDEVMNEMVQFYYFGGDPKKSMEHIKKKEPLIPERDSDEVLIQVEASTVSKTDCYVRHGRLWTAKGKDMLPIVPGVDFIGEVVKCGERVTETYGIKNTDRVAALIQTGGNSKYILENANVLVHVPKKVNAAEAAIMVEIYLSAFQALLFGMEGDDRYQNRPLEGKDVLILGGISTINQAMIELAVFFGANEIYTTAVDKHVDLLGELGATVLEMSIENWLPVVKGRMDIVVDSYCDDQYESPYLALNPGGKLICHGMQSLMNEEPGCITSLEKIWAHTKSKYMSQTHKYDVYTYWEANLEESKEDLAFLFMLLQKKAINPVLADTLPLRKVAKAHSFIEAPRRIQGSFVCLPHSEG